MGNKKQQPCPTCGGTGQISYFKGESRFLLSDEECPACCGLGYVIKDTGQEPRNKKLPNDE